MSQSRKKVGPAAPAAERQQNIQKHLYHLANKSGFGEDRQGDRNSLIGGGL